MQVTASFGCKPIVTPIEAADVGLQFTIVEYICSRLHREIAAVKFTCDHAVVNFMHNLPAFTCTQCLYGYASSGLMRWEAGMADVVAAE